MCERHEEASTGVRFKDIDGLRNKLGELFQRWDDRLILENLSLSEAYIDGLIAIVLVMDERLGSGSERALLTENGAVGSLMSSNKVDGARTSGGRVVLLILADRDTEAPFVRHSDNKRPVLVRAIKSVQGPEVIVPSLVWRYDISEYVSEFGRDSLYASKLYGGYKSFPRITRREIHGGTFRVVAASPDDAARYEIQGRAQAMDCIADDGRDAIDVSSGALHHDMVIGATRIVLLIASSGIRVDFVDIGDPRLKLADVLVGPFDL